MNFNECTMYILRCKWTELTLENVNLKVSLNISKHDTVNQLYSPARKFQEICDLHLLNANNSWYNSGSHTMIKKILPHTNTVYDFYQ